MSIRNWKTIGLALTGIGVSLWLLSCGPRAPIDSQLSSNSYAKRAQSHHLLEFSGDPFASALKEVPEGDYTENGIYFERKFPRNKQLIWFQASWNSIDNASAKGDPFNSETRIYNNNGTAQVCTALYFSAE